MEVGRWGLRSGERWDDVGKGDCEETVRERRGDAWGERIGRRLGVRGGGGRATRAAGGSRAQAVPGIRSAGQIEFIRQAAR